MAIKYAMPIGHRPVPPTGFADYSDFATTVTVGRLYRQPVIFDGQTTFAPGLELILDDLGSIPEIFAVLDGTLHFQAQAGASDAQISLIPSPTISTELGTVFFAHSIEASPARIIYQNVDVAASKAALLTLLKNAQDPHPALKEKVAIKNPTTGKTEIKTVAQHTPEVVLDQFFAGTVDTPLVVRAADRIAIAAAAGAANPGKRRVVFVTQDLGLQELNPLFVIKQLLLSDQSVNPTTPRPAVVTTSLTSLAPTQPVLKLVPDNPTPREEVQITVGTQNFPQAPIPFGRLAQFHRFPFDSGLGANERRLSPQATPPPVGPTPLAAVFEARNVSTQVTYQPHTGGPSDLTTIQTAWGLYADALNAVCRLLVVPVEVVLAILGTETRGGGLAYRFEPLKDSDRAKFLNLPNTPVPATYALMLAYDKTIGVPATIASVSLDDPPEDLGDQRSEADGRPRTHVKVALATGTRTFSKWARDWIPKKNKNGDEVTPDNPRRHFLFLDGPDGPFDLAPRPRLREIAPVTTNGQESKVEADMVVDDQQLECNRQKSDGKSDDPLLACGQPSSDDTQGASVAHYNPNDRCQRVAGSATLTDDVQYTIRRAAVLRALYVTVKSNTGTATVTLVLNGQASTTFLVQLGQGVTKASLVNSATNVQLAAGDKISWRVDVAGGALTGLRTRVHLAPLVDAPISLMDAAANDGVSGKAAPGNVYPPTGVNPQDPVRGAVNNTEHPLTWLDMAKVVQILSGTNVSPGIAQTLISTADTDLIDIEKAIPDLEVRLASVGVTPRPRGADRFGKYLVDPTAPNSLGWLMIAPNAILAGACHIRRQYLGRGKTTPHSFDLPAFCAGYNRGTIAPAAQKKGQTQKLSRWGVGIDDAYVDRAIGFYNATVQFFESTPPPNPAPGIRFRP